MLDVIRSDIQNLHAYAVQPSTGFIKLDVMENPFRLPEALQAALGQRLGLSQPSDPGLIGWRSRAVRKGHAARQQAFRRALAQQ